MTDKELAEWLQKRLDRWLTIDLWQRDRLEKLVAELKGSK
jgi:endonuclease YncB( thermonuclease family)